MKNEIELINAAINSATYRLDELEKAQAMPAATNEAQISKVMADSANKLKILEAALHENADSLRDDLAGLSHNLNGIKKDVKKDIELLNGQISEIKNDLSNAQTMIADILRELQGEIKKTVTKDFISDLYKKG